MSVACSSAGKSQGTSCICATLDISVTRLLSARAERRAPVFIVCKADARAAEQLRSQRPAGGSGGPSAMRTTTTTSGGRLQFKTGLARLRKGHWPWDGTQLFLYLNCKKYVFLVRQNGFVHFFFLRISFQNKVLLR